MRLIFLLLLAGTLRVSAEWPQFLGPNRDGSHPDRLGTNWPAAGPVQLWKRPVGEGFAAPVIADERLVIFHRIAEQEELACLDAGSGKDVWRFAYPATYEDDFGFEAGPRATPAISKGDVFAMGADGVVSCVRMADGKRIWQVDTRKQFKAGKGFFGMACSPLVENGLVLLNIGGANGAGIIALERATGKLRWKATDDEASYSSPLAASVAGQRFAFFLTREGLVILEPETGKVVAEKSWRARMHASVNGATPLLVAPNRLFLTASYGAGATLLEFDPPRLRTIWAGDSSLSSHYAGVVHHNGFLYGYDGRQEHGPDLVCVELKSGRVAWREQRFGAGSILLAGDQLVLLRENGELVLATATPERFTPEGTAQIVGEARAYPALSKGRLYARDKKQLVCVQTGQTGPQ